MTDEQIDRLLNTLNKLAQERDWYEYGLPETDREQFYDAVRQWLTAQQDA